MTRRRRANVPWGFERAVLSDVLPYELPVSFANARFAELLAKLSLDIGANEVRANWLGPATPAILSLIFGGEVKVAKPSSGKRVRFVDPRNFKGDQQFVRSRPLSFNIGKNAGGVRAIAMMHPRAQFAVADFYRRHGDTILYFTTRSSYSIRHPKDIARYTVARDGVFSKSLDKRATGVEQHDSDYEQLRSYFTYGGYSQSYKFHESAELRHLERRFARLVHVDVTRCFDSIYTHTISWVTNGIEHSKTMTKKTAQTFGGRFDKLMQSANDLETHGILIGSEVSRIFAEIILQEVDARVERELRENVQRPLLQRQDYEIRRFVDDYFIFCSSEENATRIVEVLGNQLKDFKLYLNDAKREDEATPLASKRSVGKYQIKQTINRLVQVHEGDEPGSLPRLVTSAEALLVEFKGALLSADLSHMELANYALVQIEFAFEHALDRWRQAVNAEETAPAIESDWVGLVRFISSIIDVAAAIFAGSVSASHSVKLARISHTALRFTELVNMPRSLRAGAESKIAEELKTFVRRPSETPTAPMHVLVLLDALASMGEVGALRDRELRDLLHMEISSPNAIALLVVLRHCGRRPDLAKLKADVEKQALGIAKGALNSTSLDTNATLLAAALLDSPFQSSRLKRELAKALGLPGNPRPGGSAPSVGFFEWEIPDYYEALQRKRGGDVY